ncbi:MAG: hypothetical protein KAK04_24215 [Cyclobacteriaceae bacterium]|nr:hypothetical protein [Cyclobacteriaceae bacterium]
MGVNRMHKHKIVLYILLVVILLGISSAKVLADGDENLGVPSIKISDGSGIVASGTGLLSQPGIINIGVPNDAEIKQVLLYWNGFHTNGNEDNTIIVEGINVRGKLIGVRPSTTIESSVYRVDITRLKLINAGSNNLEIEGLDFDVVNNGAGIIVIFDNGPDKDIQIRDGEDWVYINSNTDILRTTVAQTFTFEPANVVRTADLSMSFSSVSGSMSSGGFRPSAIEVIVDGVTTELNNLLDSNDGDEWDTLSHSVTIPPGATEVKVQAFSENRVLIEGTPASFVWITAALSLSPPVNGRMTGGGSIFNDNNMENDRVTHGFEIHCDKSEPNNLEVNWPGNHFHMLDLTSAICTDNELIIQKPPVAPLDTFFGMGTGRLNGVDGARIEFTFVDAGEPGTKDTALIKIWNPSDNVVLDVFGNIQNGNQQAHYDNK